jgi:hypothetical protein
MLRLHPPIALFVMSGEGNESSGLTGVVPSMIAGFHWLVSPPVT